MVSQWESSLLALRLNGVEATESARSDVVSQLCSSCDSRSRVRASERHQLAERLSDGRRVPLSTPTNNTIKCIVLIGGFLVVSI